MGTQVKWALTVCQPLRQQKCLWDQSQEFETQLVELFGVRKFGDPSLLKGLTPGLGEAWLVLPSDPSLRGERRRGERQVAGDTI